MSASVVWGAGGKIAAVHCGCIWWLGPATASPLHLPSPPREPHTSQPIRSHHEAWLELSTLLHTYTYIHTYIHIDIDIQGVNLIPKQSVDFPF